MKKAKKEELDTFYEIEKIAPATECTGIAPTVPENEVEADEIGELYDIHTPKPKDRV